MDNVTEFNVIGDGLMSNRKGEVWMEFRANIPLILEKLDQGWPASHIWRFLKAEGKFTGSERHFWLLIVTQIGRAHV